MNRFLHRHVLLPLFESGLKRRKVFPYWRELERSQWLSPAELELRQFDSLRRLLAHASASCPYYREEWLRRGLTLGDLREPSDFWRWPLVTREDIRANRLRMRSYAPGLRLLPGSTGGSTGLPLLFDFDTGSADWRTAAWHRGYGWAGAAPDTRQVALWSVPLGRRPWWANWKDYFYHRLYRRRILSVFDLSEERVPQYLDRLNRWRPDVLVAYSYSLHAFARSLEERKLHPFSPRAIVVGAEKLYPYQRKLIEKVFNAPVYETYGSREFMLIGAECDRHQGLHVTMENLLVEVVDDSGQPTPPGSEGNVVITDLHNYGMPFIRYVTGDRSVAGWRCCPCGRGLPLLGEVTGRRTDMIHTPDGRHISGVFFPHLLKEFPAVQRFQVIQKELDHIQLRMVLKGAWTEIDRRLLDGSLRSVLGSRMRLEYVPLDHIPLTASGKLRIVINQVTEHEPSR